MSSRLDKIEVHILALEERQDKVEYSIDRLWKYLSGDSTRGAEIREEAKGKHGN
jgi:hypothetical protein